MEATFDEKRARLDGPDLFKRFVIGGKAVDLSSLGMADDHQLIVYEQGNSRYGFLLDQMDYHHVAQGELDGVPFIITFCGVCHSAMGFDPTVDGKIHHFSAGGLYNGVILLVDDETGTYWDHMTGRAVHGPLRGRRLNCFGVEITTSKAELLRENSAGVFVSKPPLGGRLFMAVFGQKSLRRKGFMPPYIFKRTMAPLDPRLAKMAQGLGVVINDEARFYPMQEIQQPVSDTLGGTDVVIRLKAADGVPEAVDGRNSLPYQLFCRWYGFSYTFPECSVFGQRGS